MPFVAGVDNDEVEFYGYSDLSAMRIGKSKQIKVIAWIASIALVCVVFYVVNLPSEKSTLENIPDRQALNALSGENTRIVFNGATALDPYAKLDELGVDDIATLRSLSLIHI